MNIIKGVVPVLITPINEFDEVDTYSLSKLVTHLNTKNIGGFWVLGTGAEDMSLTYQQRLQVVETVVNANNGKSPLIIGASFFSMKDTLSFIKDTENLDFDAFHIMPYHNLISLNRIEWLYKTLADKSKKPLWMYTSANWCSFIPPEFVEKMKYHSNIAGIKFSTSNAVHTEKVISLADRDFQVITAVAKTFFSNLSMGVKAGTTVEACAFSDLIIDIYENFKQGDISKSLEMQRKYNRLSERMPPQPGIDNFLKVAEIKYILSKLDICKEYMSGYYRELNIEEKEHIDKILNDFL